MKRTTPKIIILGWYVSLINVLVIDQTKYVIFNTGKAILRFWLIIRLSYNDICQMALPD